MYERLPKPPAPDDLSVWGDFDTTSDRLYMIGINGRGQAVLRGLGAMERIDRFATKVAGRMDWTPGKPEPRRQIYSDRQGRALVNFAREAVPRRSVNFASLPHCSYMDFFVCEHMKLT